MKVIISTFTLVCVLLMVSCGNNKTLINKNIYSIRVPTDWKEDNSEKKIYQVLSEKTGIVISSTIYIKENATIEEFSKYRYDAATNSFPFLKIIEAPYTNKSGKYDLISYKYEGVNPEDNSKMFYYVLCYQKGKYLVSFTFVTDPATYSSNKKVINDINSSFSFIIN